MRSRHSFYESTHTGGVVGTMEILRKQLAALHNDCLVWSMQCCRGDEEEAEEVLQCVYEKIISGRAVYSGRSVLKTWVFGVIRKTAWERIRRRDRRRKLLRLFRVEPYDVSTPQDEMESMERKDRVQALLAELSERQRTVIELVFYHDLTIAEAADVMGISLGTARVHYDRAKKELRKRLDQMGEQYALGR